MHDPSDSDIVDVGSSGSNAASRVNNSNEPPPNTSTKTNMTSRDGWKTKDSRRRKPAVHVFGNRKGNPDNVLTVKGAPPRFEYVVFNIDNEIMQDTLKDYIVNNGTTVLEINRLSKPEWNRQSYRVLTYLSDKDKVMSCDYWPELVGVRLFTRLRRIEAETDSKIL